VRILVEQKKKKTDSSQILHTQKTQAQMGLSGVVFMLILLNSLLAVKTRKIPITFLIVAYMWVRKEVG
jgi:hypothetical protein